MAKYKVQVLLGAEAVWAYNHEEMSARGAANEYDGELRTHTFNSKKERDAYLKGFNEATGWPDTAVVKLSSSEV